MINGKTILAIIPARGGSKGLPGKNIVDVGGKPLLAWTIDQAKESKYIDRFILSTDDAEIISVAEQYGCDVPFVRPKALASDSAGSMGVVFHVLETLQEKFDYVALLQVTSPLRTASDIDACVEQCEKLNVPACVSVVEVDKSPYWMYHLGDNNLMQPVMDRSDFPTRRQDTPKVYAINGAVYVARTRWIVHQNHFVTAETVAFVMPKERSIDIDSPLDLAILKTILSVH